MKILTASLSDCVTTIEVTSSDSYKSDPSKKADHSPHNNLVMLSPNQSQYATAQFKQSLPSRPENLSFEPIEKNNDKLKQWLLNRLSASTFNRCPHQSHDRTTH